MGHRTIGLPFADAELRFTGGLLWARPAFGTQRFAYDPGSLTVAARLTSEGNRTFVVDHGLLVTDIGHGDVRAMDAKTGAIVWERAGYVQGTTERGFLISTSHTLELVAPDATATLLARDDASYLPMAGIVAEGHVWTVVGKYLIGFALAAEPERARTIALGKGSVIPFAGRLEPLGDGRTRLLLVEQLEERRGPRIRLSAVEGSSLQVICEIDGEVGSAVAVGDMVMFSMREEGHRIVVLGDRRVEISDATGACVCGGALATLQEGAVVVVTAGQQQGQAQGQEQGQVLGSRQAGLTVSRAALPVETHWIASSDTHFYASAGSRLFVVDPAELVPGDQAITYAWADPKGRRERRREAPSGEPDPAQVVFAGAKLVTVNHPRLGRLNLDRALCATPLAKGDDVLLDGVESTMPGVWTVSAWHKAGEEPGQVQPAVVEVAADNMPRLFRDPVTKDPPQRPALEAALRRHGLSLGGRLEQLVSLRDGDPAFRRWLDQISILLRITGLSITAAEGTDPCLLGIAGNGGGDVTSLYVYPPAIAAGVAPPVVDFWHETLEVSYLAPDFDTYLDDSLRRAEEDEIPRLIIEKLGGLAEMRPPTEPPAWFVAVHGDGPPPDPKEVAKLKKSDPLMAERLLVRLLREDPDDRKVAKDLAAVYKTLGWSWHRENLLANQD